jgi:hypothetical protein
MMLRATFKAFGVGNGEILSDKWKVPPILRFVMPFPFPVRFRLTSEKLLARLLRGTR